METDRKLDALNFALAGAREGFGPFLGVYLQSKGFDPAATGLAMSLAGAAGLIVTTPIGALIDRSEAKRTGLVLAVSAIAIGAVAIVMTRSAWVIGGAQMLIGIGDTSVAPLVAALTLGIVGHGVFNKRLARNEAFNHAGNAANALLAGVLGYTLGLGYVAAAIAVMAIASSAVIGTIDARTIDHRVARGGDADGRSTAGALIGIRALLLLAVTVLLLQTASGALAPFLAQARTASGSNPSITTAVMTIVAQGTMVIAAISAIRLAKRMGYSGVITLALAITASRGALAMVADSWGAVICVQILEGVSMGFSGVAVPALVAIIMKETGRTSAGLGAVLTAFGAGASLSPLVAGAVAQWFGYPVAFATLGCTAIVGLCLWTFGRHLPGVDLEELPPLDGDLIDRQGVSP